MRKVAGPQTDFCCFEGHIQPLAGGLQGLFCKFSGSDVSLNRNPVGKPAVASGCNERDLKLNPEQLATLFVIDQFAANNLPAA